MSAGLELGPCPGRMPAAHRHPLPRLRRVFRGRAGRARRRLPPRRRPLYPRAALSAGARRARARPRGARRRHRPRARPSSAACARRLAGAIQSPTSNGTHPAARRRRPHQPATWSGQANSRRAALFRPALLSTFRHGFGAPLSAARAGRQSAAGRTASPIPSVERAAPRASSPSSSSSTERGAMPTYNNVISRADAQATIPEDVSNALLTGLTNESAALDGFQRIPVAQTQTRLPVLSALPTAYWVSGDTGLKQTTEVNWANKFLNIEELAAIVPIPESVLDDAGFDVWGSVRPLLEQAIARALDAAVFFGINAPASFPQNVVAAAVAAGNTVTRGTNNAAAGGIIGDLSDVFATVEQDGYAPDALVANMNLRGRLRQARSTAGESLDDGFVAELRDSAKYPMRGLWPTGASAAAAIAFQRDQFVLGVRQDFTYKVLTEAVIQDGSGAIVYNLAQQDMVALRVTFRAGWQVANTVNYDQATEANRYPAGVLREA